MLYLAVIVPFIAYFLPIENKKIKTIIAIAPTIFIIMFRFGLGTDYFSYEFLYRQHDTSSLIAALKSQSYAMESGFGFLIYIFKSFNLSFHIFAASISLIIYAFFIKWLVDIDQETSLEIMLFNGMFLVIWVLSGLRQGLVLSIGTYFFFNKKVSLNNWQKILLILLLGQLHASAYIYFIIMLAENLKLTKKSLSVILLISLVFTMIPYYLILEPFSDIKIVHKYLTYLTGKLGFWDFPGMIRLTFAVFILFFYDVFAKNKYIKELANMSILGFSLYFLLKSSEITASRINIFTFILIIPLFTYLARNLFSYKAMYLLAILGLFSFSMVYLEKDLIGHQKEVGFNSPNIAYKFKNINTVEYSDYFNYDNRYAFLIYQPKSCELKRQISSPLNRPENNNGYFVVKDKNSKLFGVINDIGKWHIEPIFKEKPELLENILIVNQGGEKLYKDLSLNPLSDVSDLVDQSLDKKRDIIAEKSWQRKVSYDDYKEDLDHVFPNEDKIKDVVLATFELPFRYYTLIVNYDDDLYHFMLNIVHNTDRWELQSDLIYTDQIRYNINNMALVSTYCGEVILNSSGDIVWLVE